jgi:uncharacterized protein YndB with AHSA1/START domain
MSNKIPYQLEYIFKSSPHVMYNLLFTDSGLSAWFCDKVDIDEAGVYTFCWADSQEKAEIIDKKNESFIRFKWLEDDSEDSYFEFCTEVDPITNEIALIITDFEEEDEIESAKELWNKQISKLFQKLGV